MILVGASAIRVLVLNARVLPIAQAQATFAGSIMEATLATIEFVRCTPDLKRLLAETDIEQASRDLLRPTANSGDRYQGLAAGT